jgi:hypothetical protein
MRLRTYETQIFSTPSLQHCAINSWNKKPDSFPYLAVMTHSLRSRMGIGKKKPLFK